MVQMTYSNLTGTKGQAGSIKSDVNNSTIESDTVLMDAEAYLNMRLRAREMLSTNTGTMTAGQSEVPLPSGWRAGVKLELIAPTNLRLTSKLIEDVEAARFYSGTTGLIGTAVPNIWAPLGSAAVFPSAADQQYVYRWVFYKEMPTLSTATETTWLTLKNPRVIRLTCRAYAYEWLRNAPQYEYWLGKADELIDQVNGESNSEQVGLDTGISSG